MLQPVDVLVVLGLLRAHEPWTVRSVAAGLRLPPATVQRALQRLAATPAYVNGHVGVSGCEQLLFHALPFVVSTGSGEQMRGMRTAWAAPPLADAVADDSPPPVWPDPSGDARGFALAPLHPSVPALARADRELYELLALVDGLRTGGPRVHALAANELRERLFPHRRVSRT